MLFRSAAVTAVVTSAMLVASPSAAVELPRGYVPATAGVGTFDPDGVNVDNHRRWRRDRVDAGDVIAGVVVLGTLAAVANAASKARQDRAYRYPQRYPYPHDRYDYRGPRQGSGWGSAAIDRAVGSCVQSVERSARVDTVDAAERSAIGWRVSGRLATGTPFTCRVSDDGRVDDVRYGAGGYAAGGQWDDERYAAARRAQDGASSPAYPGGPVAGDVEQPEPEVGGGYPD